MAMVLDALSSYLLNMVTEMTKEEINTLFGASSEMEKMKDKLGDLKRFLADADRRNIIDKTVQKWVGELKGAMYDATDIIDLCQLKSRKRGKRLDAGCCNPLLFCLRDPLFAHDIGSRMKKLNQKLDDIKHRSAQFNFISLGLEDHGRNSTSLHSSRRETSGDLNASALVGEKIVEDARNLVEMLTKETIGEHNKIMVVAIVGVGGIGKTTLAQMIFNNDKIKTAFTRKLWLSVNQDFDHIELLRKAVAQANGDHQAPTKDRLQSTLIEVLKDQVTLLVMDDVWDCKAWVDVLETPLSYALAPGSRVLVTTRNDMVARGMKAVEPYHRVEKLKSEDAWSLLKKQVVGNRNDEHQVNLLKDIVGMRIIERCDGLPLAVKVMGGLLRQKKIRRGDWENVLNNATWSVSPMPEDLNFAVYLSYQNLHSSLKSCFLHFSLLPKSKVFYADDIVGMWISEGFVYGVSNDLEEIGKEYYSELIQRNLLEPNAKYIDQVVCSMHDVVRSFAQYVAKDEALVAHGSKINTNDKLFIRVSVEAKGSQSNEVEWTPLQTQTSLRTLILVGQVKTKPGDWLVNFSSLRTLYLRNFNGDGLAKSLLQLKHLRYLSVNNNSRFTLPEKIGKMKFLQYIRIWDCPRQVKLPGSIRQLQNLRFLGLDDRYMNNVPKGFNGLTNLRKLFLFPAHMDGDWCSLKELGPLTKLMSLDIYGLENISSSSFAREAKLFQKVHLRFLCLRCNSRHGDDNPLLTEDKNTFNHVQQQIEKVFDELCPPSSLENLKVTGYFGRQLPRWMMSAAATLESLRILSLEDLPFCTKIPDDLFHLPFLEFIQIHGAAAITCIGPEFLQPINHEHPRALENFGSAVKLQVAECPCLVRVGNLTTIQDLTIYECPKLKVLEGMSKVRRLVLWEKKMETLPGYLKDAKPRNLEVGCDISLLISMATGKSGPEWDKFSHIKQVNAYFGFERKWYVEYTRDPLSLKTNISHTIISRARKVFVFLAYHGTCPIDVERDNHRPFCQRFGWIAYCQLFFWLRRVCPHCCEANNNISVLLDE